MRPPASGAAQGRCAAAAGWRWWGGRSWSAWVGPRLPRGKSRRGYFTRSGSARARPARSGYQPAKRRGGPLGDNGRHQASSAVRVVDRLVGDLVGPEDEAHAFRELPPRKPRDAQHRERHVWLERGRGPDEE